MKTIRRMFDKILRMMAIDWKRCSDAEFSMSVTIYNAKLSQRLAHSTLVLYTMAVMFYSSHIFVNRTDGDKTFNVSTRRLVLHMDIPFDINRKFIYELIIIVQFIHLHLCSCMIGLLNVLLINLILHVGGQIDILRRWLMEIFSKERKHPSLSTIKRIIRKHQRIIIFSGYIEDLYSSVAMVVFVSDTLIICCLAFILVTSIGTSNGLKIIMRVLLFYLAMNMEAFAFCFAGEYLSAKSKSIGDAAYNSLWYEADSKDIWIILFLIMRSQTEITITIGKVMNLSLERFTGLLRASASYVSVLLAMN
ncbi:odorant receptor 10-like isoform X2 [Linepithema humile]|uniref:odorant receptor 10-like isoform X2 n=1 Tax=Linepithema humile TaxID=83485 RepID=UPI00351DD246